MTMTAEEVLKQLQAYEPDYDALAASGPNLLGHLAVFVESPDPMLASKAVAAASQIDDPEALSLLRTAATCPDPTVRAAAAHALGAILERAHEVLDAHEVLAALLTDPDAGVRKLALLVVHERQVPSARDAVAAMVAAEPEPWLRDLAARVLSIPEPPSIVAVQLVMAAQAAASELLMGLPHVVGLGTGLRAVDGVDTGELAVVVLVDRKVPPDELAPGTAVPATVPDPAGGPPIRTDVVEYPPVPLLVRPVPGGVSISTARGGNGTLGGWVTDRIQDVSVLLSNWHVLSPRDPADTAVIQPGVSDGGRYPDDVIATFERAAPYVLSKATPPPVNEVDAAIAMPLGGVPWVPVIAGIGAAVLEVGVPFAGMAVRKHGKKSGPTEGHVSIGNIDSDKVPRSDTASGGAVIANTFSIKPDPNLLDPLAPPRPFAEHGDSGSLIFSRTRGSVPGTYPVVGLLWGGDALVSAANDIRAVFRILDLGPLYGSRAMLEQAWPANYSSFAPFTLGGAQHVLEYHAASGRVSIDEIAATTASSDGKTTPAISITERFTAKWAPDYTAFVPFVSDGDTYVLEYSAVTGEVFIERLAASAGGIVTTTTYKGKWTRGWTAFAAFTLGGLPHYLAYKQATGQVALDRLLHGGTGVTTLMTATWDERGLTAIVPLESDGNTYLLEYNATSGAMYVQRVRPDGRALTTTHTEGWQQGWSAIMPFTDKDKQPFYLAYMAGRGDATIGRLRSLGAGVERLSYVTDWPRDVTALAPLVLPRGPHLLRYAAGGKAVVEILHTARSP